MTVLLAYTPLHVRVGLISFFISGVASATARAAITGDTSGASETRRPCSVLVLQWRWQRGFLGRRRQYGMRVATRLGTVCSERSVIVL
jgi:hypothetical protein